MVEGAGSPAETNLRQGDIANMGFAKAANVPVILAGDIDRGGVIASIVGTHTVLDDEDRGRIRGFIINKFRGDTRLFAEGIATIETLTGWPSIGVLPWFPRCSRVAGGRRARHRVGEPATAPPQDRRAGAASDRKLR